MKNKKIIILIILILISILTLIGSSYALLTKSFKSEKLSMQVGTLKVDFTEGNAITMDNAMPMTDENGMNTTPYTFTITNSGDVDAYYTVSNEEELANTLDTNYLKMRLTGSDGYDSGIKRLKDLGTSTYRIVDETSLATGKSVTYKLYLWISSDADNSVQDKVYKSKIVISSTSNKTNDTVAGKLLKGVGNNGFIDTTDSEQTFIVGTNPNNYIWYSGKLWRAVSIDPTDNSVKLVTQWNISVIPFNQYNNASFKDSYMEQWLNDTSVDGFLGNLREPEKFIKTDSVWNTTISKDITAKPEKNTLETDAVGLLNAYEYTMSYKSTTSENGYLNNGLYSYTLTPRTTSTLYVFHYLGYLYSDNIASGYPFGVRPSINLKSSIKIISGNGTAINPYRLEGDNDSPNDVLLSTRYSGEYISFGVGENNLYRIVSHENGTGTKIVSAQALIENKKFKQLIFDDSSLNYSVDTVVGKILNNEYLTDSLYLTTEQVNMIEENTTWYLGKVSSGYNYKLAKYSNLETHELVTNIANAKVGMLRIGELLNGSFENYKYSSSNWTLTPTEDDTLRRIGYNGDAFPVKPNDAGNTVKPTFNLKSNVVITGGDGTKNNPFTVKLG